MSAVPITDAPKSRSIQRRLTLLLGAAVLLAAVAATLSAFLLAYREASEFQDDLLRQIAALVEPAVAADSAEQRLPRPALSDPESRIGVLRLPGDTPPDWLPRDLGPGLHRLAANTETLQVFVRAVPPSGRRIIAFQPTDTRDEIALSSALFTLVPLLLLLPVMTGLIVWIVRRELAPIRRLAEQLDARPADRPGPMPDAGVPSELQPFVRAISRLLERVGELLQQQRRFIADAAHEIRSPLTALSLQARNLGQAQTLEAARERLLPLQAGIERARRLTEQLLSLARLQAGAQPLAQIDVAALARALIAEHLSAADARGIDLGLEAVAPVRIAAAPETLRLILRNGLDNALRYSRAGGEVTLRIRAEAPDAVIEIVDDGPGIPAGERALAMEPFHRLPHGGSQEGERLGSQDSARGSGLGLSIAREAAARLGGVLELAQRQGGTGLVFRYRQRLAAGPAE